MDLERVILSQVRENSIQYCLYMEPKKKQNTYEREIESQIQKTNLEFPEEKVEGRDKLEA